MISPQQLVRSNAKIQVPSTSKLHPLTEGGPDYVRCVNDSGLMLEEEGPGNRQVRMSSCLKFAYSVAFSPVLGCCGLLGYL